jgi:16S rRNA (guanine(966)-N(2))-methyltransferase RsmD
MKPSGSVRIIGGQWKRSILPVTNAKGLRPTPNRVRETLFNWLGQDLSGLCCVDAFAGTGALGFEAASRGAAVVLMCEQDPAAERNLMASRDKLNAKNIRIHRSDALSFLDGLPPASQDVIFLDPPFASDLYVAAITKSASIIKKTGKIYLECNHGWTTEALAPFSLTIEKQGKSGMVHYMLLQSS